jgi:hypothetical protein
MYELSFNFIYHDQSVNDELGSCREIRIYQHIIKAFTSNGNLTNYYAQGYGNDEIETRPDLHIKFFCYRTENLSTVLELIKEILSKTQFYYLYYVFEILNPEDDHCNPVDIGDAIKIIFINSDILPSDMNIPIYTSNAYRELNSVTVGENSQNITDLVSSCRTNSIFEKNEIK